MVGYEAELGVNGFSSLWGAGWLLIPLYPTRRLLAGLSWLFGAVLGLLLGWCQWRGCGALLLQWGGELPQKKRLSGMCGSVGETEEGRLEQPLRFEFWD